MDEKTLREFWIINCGGNLMIHATDDAYKLLGIDVKTKSWKENDGRITRHDLMPKKYYLYAFFNFLNEQYVIDGLYRESLGDDGEQNMELTIFNGGGKWKEALDEYRDSKKYLPEYMTIIDKKCVSKEIMEEWPNLYEPSGGFVREGTRKFFCAHKDGSKEAFLVRPAILLGRASDKWMKYDSNDFAPANIFLKKTDRPDILY